MTQIPYSCNLIPSPRIVEEAKLAERLGYKRVYVTDSPALYGDVWVALAQIAAATETIGLGTGVLVPHTRHPVVNATAIAAIESMAPGRLAVAIGTGNSARRCLGERRGVKMSWLRDYIVALRQLLAGETVEWEGHRTALIPPAGYLPDLPIDVPIYLSAFGPKGLGLAGEIADGLMGSANREFETCVVVAFGTVLDDGEAFGSERSIQAHTPLPLTQMHNMYEDDPAQLDTVPGGTAWRATLDANIPEADVHLLVHKGHCVEVGPLDHELVHDPAWLAWSRPGSFTGTPAEVAQYADRMRDLGATEVMFLATGPDISRELTTFASALNQ